MDDFKILCWIFCIWDFLILIILIGVGHQIWRLTSLVKQLGHSNIKELKDINKKIFLFSQLNIKELKDINKKIIYDKEKTN